MECPDPRQSDEFLASEGMVVDSQLSEHQTEGWLEGYLLTGRHGLMNSYEAFIRIVDSMTSQHAKWIKMCNELPWREPISSLNYLLTSHVWRQDHKWFHAPRPGFIDFLVNKKLLPCASICPRRQQLVVRHGSHATQPQLHQPSRLRQARRRSVAHHGPGSRALHRRRRRMEMGFYPSPARSPMLLWPPAATSQLWESMAAVSILREAPLQLKIPCCQRGRPHEIAARHRTPARPI